MSKGKLAIGIVAGLFVIYVVAMPYITVHQMKPTEENRESETSSDKLAEEHEPSEELLSIKIVPIEEGLAHFDQSKILLESNNIEEALAECEKGLAVITNYLDTQRDSNGNLPYHLTKYDDKLAEWIDVKKTLKEKLLKTETIISTAPIQPKEETQNNLKQEPKALLDSLDSKDEELVLDALVALGKLGLPADNTNVHKVAKYINHPNQNLMKVAIITIGKFTYLRPFHYDKPFEVYPYEKLIEALPKITDAEIKNQVLISLEKISTKKFATDEKWTEWWEEEAIVMELLTKTNNLQEDAKKQFSSKRYKEAQESINQIEETLELLKEKHIRHWIDFDKFLEKKKSDVQAIKNGHLQT